MQLLELNTSKLNSRIEFKTVIISAEILVHKIKNIKFKVNTL